MLLLLLPAAAPRGWPRVGAGAGCEGGNQVEPLLLGRMPVRAAAVGRCATPGDYRPSDITSSSPRRKFQLCRGCKPVTCQCHRYCTNFGSSQAEHGSLRENNQTHKARPRSTVSML